MSCVGKRVDIPSTTQSCIHVGFGVYVLRSLAGTPSLHDSLILQSQWVVVERIENFLCGDACECHVAGSSHWRWVSSLWGWRGSETAAAPGRGWVGDAAISPYAPIAARASRAGAHPMCCKDVECGAVPSNTGGRIVLFVCSDRRIRREQARCRAGVPPLQIRRLRCRELRCAAATGCCGCGASQGHAVCSDVVLHRRGGADNGSGGIGIVVWRAR